MASYHYDIIIIGGGPAGYAGAIRASQLKKSVLCIEREHLGGICLNWGCIPTKALLTNAHLVETLRDQGDVFGYEGNGSWKFPQMIARSRKVASTLNSGIEGLFRKYKVKYEMGAARVIAPHKVKLGDKVLTAANIIVATGTRPRELPGLPFDGEKVINYKDAMVLKSQPKSMVVIGAGAIGCEFSYFYNAIGTEVTLIEMQDRILPVEDAEVSAVLDKSLANRGLRILTKTKTTHIDTSGNGVRVTVETPKGQETIEAEVLLVAIGVTGNVEEVLAPDLGVELVKNHIKVDKHYKTGVEGLYAVGDVIGPPWLAHVAHHEAICCIERICGYSDRYVDYETIPGCTYTDPGVASVGLTEAQAREAGHDLRIGKFPFVASGRAQAADETEGFVKLIFDKKYGELLGAHLVGSHATEMISELVMAKKLEATEEEIIHAMHPHPTFSEAVMEAAGQGLGESVHI